MLPMRNYSLIETEGIDIMRSNTRTWLAIVTLCAMGLLIFSGNAAADDDDDDDNFDFSAGEVAVILVIIIVIFIVMIKVGIWVYREANRRGMDGTLWLIALFLGNVMAFIIFYIVRKDHPVVGGIQGPDQSQPQELTKHEEVE